MWELLLTVLADSGKKGELTRKWVLQLPLGCQNLIELMRKHGTISTLEQSQTLRQCVNRNIWWRTNVLWHFEGKFSCLSFKQAQFVLFSQCILPCIVQLLPKNSIFIKCIRAYQCYRLMIGLNCMSERRLQRLSDIIERYKNTFMVCSFFKCSFIGNILIQVYVIEFVQFLR